MVYEFGNKQVKEHLSGIYEFLEKKKPRVGIVGEILVKFSPSANNGLVDLLEHEGAEAVVPDLMDFLLYCFKNTEFKAKYLGKKKMTARMGRLGIKALEFFRSPANKALERRFLQVVKASMFPWFLRILE